MVKIFDYVSQSVIADSPRGISIFEYISPGSLIGDSIKSITVFDANYWNSVISDSVKTAVIFEDNANNSVLIDSSMILPIYDSGTADHLITDFFGGYEIYDLSPSESYLSSVEKIMEIYMVETDISIVPDVTPILELSESFSESLSTQEAKIEELYYIFKASSVFVDDNKGFIEIEELFPSESLFDDIRAQGGIIMDFLTEEEISNLKARGAIVSYIISTFIDEEYKR